MQTPDKKIPLISSTFFKEDETKKYMSDILKNSKKLSMGEYCASFEENFSKKHERKHSLLVNSGSSANLALIQALINLGWLKKGDRVGFSALTWSTNVMPLIQLGLTPVPIDVEIETLNVSLDKLKEVKNLRAMFITNLLGLCHDLDKIAEYASKQNMILLEDNCESLGSIYKNRLLGNFSLASTFSFYVGHQMSTIEGGMVCTDNDELAEMLKMVRAHGWKRDNTDYGDDFYGRYTFYDLGCNLRPTEITGMIGLLQLEFLVDIVRARENNFKFVKEVYSRDEIYSYKTSHMDRFSSFCFPVVAKTEKLRDELLSQADEVLETRPIVGGNMTKQPFFKKYAKEYDMENASLIHSQGFYVGNNPDLTFKQLNTIKEVLCLS